MILCLSPDHRILEFNRAAERLYGQKREAVLGRDYSRLFATENHQRAFAAHIERVLDGQPSSTFENSVRSVDGQERVLQWSVSRILDAAARPLGVIAAGQDITERRQAEEALRRYEHIVCTSHDLMAFIDAQYIYQAVNAMYVDRFDKPEDQIVGHTVADLLGDKIFNTQVQPNLDRCLAGEPVSYQLWFDFPRLGRRCLDVHLNPFRDANGPVSGVVIVGRDITEQQQARQVLIEYQQRLRTLASELALASQRERRRVAAGLHDQVGQALAMIKLKLCSALESDLSVDARRALTESQTLLEQSIQATRSLTFQLSSAVLQELGLEAALQQLVEWFDAEYQDTRFVFAADSEPKPLSEDQSLMLYDVARELLFNAAKYAKADAVDLRLERVGVGLQITIEDDGLGFDTARLNGHSPEGGFGYFSIRERLAYLDGDLTIDSALGQGTRVVATTPLHES